MLISRFNLPKNTNYNKYNTNIHINKKLLFSETNIFNPNNSSNPSDWNNPKDNLNKSRWVKNMVNFIFLEISSVPHITLEDKYTINEYILKPNEIEKDKFFKFNSDMKIKRNDYFYNYLMDKIIKDNHKFYGTCNWSFFHAAQYCYRIKQMLYPDDNLQRIYINDKIANIIDNIYHIMLKNKSYWLDKPICHLCDLQDEETLKTQYTELKYECYKELFGYVYFHSLIKLHNFCQNNKEQ